MWRVRPTPRRHSQPGRPGRRRRRLRQLLHRPAAVRTVAGGVTDRADAHHHRLLAQRQVAPPGCDHVGDRARVGRLLDRLRRQVAPGLRRRLPAQAGHRRHTVWHPAGAARAARRLRGPVAGGRLAGGDLAPLPGPRLRRRRQQSAAERLPRRCADRPGRRRLARTRRRGAPVLHVRVVSRTAPSEQSISHDRPQGLGQAIRRLRRARRPQRHAGRLALELCGVPRLLRVDRRQPRPPDRCPGGRRRVGRHDRRLLLRSRQPLPHPQRRVQALPP